MNPVMVAQLTGHDVRFIKTMLECVVAQVARVVIKSSKFKLIIFLNSLC